MTMNETNSKILLDFEEAAVNVKSANEVPILFEFDQDATNYRKRVWVRLQIGGVDLIGWDGEPGAPFILSRIWIHPFAPSGLICMVVSQISGISSLNLTDAGEGLTFETQGDFVKITSSFEEKEVTVKFHSLFKAWRSFAQDVYKIVTQKQPEMIGYYKWEAIIDPYQYYKERKIYHPAEPGWFEEDDEPPYLIR